MRRFFERYKAFVSVIVIIALTVSMLPFASAAAATAHTLTPFVELNLRADASTSSSVLTTLYPGNTLTLLEDSKDGWAHVSYGSYTGYASADYLDVPQGSDVEASATPTDYVRLRSGKGTSYTVYTAIPTGYTVPVTDNSDEYWAKVIYEEYEGYASKQYLVINFKLPASAEPTQPAVTSHRSASFSNLPQNSLQSVTADDSAKLMLNASSRSLNINETFSLTLLDTSSRPMTGGLSFSSSNTKAATVSTAGQVKGIAAGHADITVTHLSTGVKYTCAVTVLSTVQPTEVPTQVPTQTPTQTPTTAPVGKLTLSASSATVYKGCCYQIIATADSAVTWSTSNSSVATVSSDGIVKALTAGTATITAKSGTKTGTCAITVVSGSTVSISHSSANITAGKTFLARSYTSGVTWTSSDTAVATVNNGYILAKKAGKTVVTVSTSTGASTILVTVTAAAPIRFAYTSPNCASKNQTVTLIAITDTLRTGVRFNVTVGSTTKTVTATSSTKDANTLVWKGTTSFSTAGTYKVAAYSQYNNAWTTCADASTTAFVSDTTDRMTTVCTARRASDEVIKLIANFEGYISSIYDDPITGDPTVGYGRVIFSGQQFYNTMTKNEAFAYLVQTVNNDGYSSDVNKFLVNNNVKFNQQQFDALVCLVYNTGSGILSGDSELEAALLNCHDGDGGTTTYYINGTYVRIRSGPGTEYDVLKELDYNTTVTVLSTSNSAWYQVKLDDGTTGYVSSDYISKRATGGNLDLNYVDRQTLINKFCAYHHAAGDCIYGLLYRRVDEMEMFFYGDYERNYGYYYYDINYTCTRNPSFHT